MNTLDRLEKRFGRFAIPNVMRIFTVIYAIGLVLWIIRCIKTTMKHPDIVW